MKRYFILLPIFFLALLQGVFLSFNLVLLTVLFWASLRSPKEVLLVAFVGGFFLDLVKGTPLGLSSFALLVTCYLLLLYRRKLDPLHPFFWPVFIFFSANVYSFIINHFFNWFEGLILAVLGMVSKLMVKYFYSGFDRREIRLKI